MLKKHSSTHLFLELLPSASAELCSLIVPRVFFSPGGRSVKKGTICVGGSSGLFLSVSCQRAVKGLSWLDWFGSHCPSINHHHQSSTIVRQGMIVIRWVHVKMGSSRPFEHRDGKTSAWSQREYSMVGLFFFLFLLLWLTSWQIIMTNYWGTIVYAAPRGRRVARDTSSGRFWVSAWTVTFERIIFGACL